MKRGDPMACNPLVAIAERAGEAGARHAVLVLLDHEGNVVMHPSEETPPVLLAGMLTFALALLTAVESDDDDE